MRRILLLAAVLAASFLLPSQARAAFTCTCNCTYQNGAGTVLEPVDAGRMSDPDAEHNVDRACQDRCTTTAEMITLEGGPYTYNNHSLSACEGTGAEGPGGTNTNGGDVGPGGGRGAPAPSLPNPLGGSTDLRTIIARVINAALGISGSIALLMFVWGGMLWLTSGGSPERIQKGKNTIVWAVLGLVLIFGSYAILNFVLGAILSA